MKTKNIIVSKNTSKISKVLLLTSSFEEIAMMTATKKYHTGVKNDDNSHYPVGLAYLHSYLESSDYQVRTLFLNNYGYSFCLKEIKKTIIEFQPQVVGLQIITANRVSSYSLIEYIHKHYPSIQIIVGGIHTTIMYEQLLKKFNYIIAVLGEGEITVMELLKELDCKNPNLKKIDGLAFWKKNSVIVTKTRKLITDLDILPFPRHEDFIDKNINIGQILTTRGCPFNCSFCSLDLISRRNVRYRSVKNVVDEIEYLINNFPQINELWIIDDSFFLDNDRVINICKEIIKRKIKIDFVCSGRAKPISKKMVKWLEKANFKRVLLGLESGDAEVLKKCHKAITPENIIEAFKVFSSSKIDLLLLLIVGLPGETSVTVKTTIELVKQLQRIKYTYIKDVSILAIYPGTEVYEIAKTSGMLDDNYWLDNKPTPIFTVENSQNQLLSYKEEMLNNISLSRLITPAGFISQLTMLPYCLKYLSSYRNQIPEVLAGSLNLMLPPIVYNVAQGLYRKIRVLNK